MDCGLVFTKVAFHNVPRPGGGAVHACTLPRVFHVYLSLYTRPHFILMECKWTTAAILAGAGVAGLAGGLFLGCKLGMRKKRRGRFVRQVGITK